MVELGNSEILNYHDIIIIDTKYYHDSETRPIAAIINTTEFY